MSYESLYFSLSDDISHITIIFYDRKMCPENQLFSLLIFEHRYLNNCRMCILDILEMYSKHSILVNRVSESIFRV